METRLCGGCGHEATEDISEAKPVLRVRDTETDEVLDLCVECLGASEGMEVL